MNLSIRNASVTLSGNTILELVNFDIKDSDHIAIVGRNGAGKTTLLKALIDNDMFDEGIGEEKFSINKIGKWTIGYLSQITFDDEDITLIDEVRKSFKDLISLENKINDLANNLNDKDVEEYTNSLENFRYLGGYTYKKEYEIMLNKFGFTDEDKDKKISEFSGGQRTKIAFIKLLLSKPDLLLLDEPTNHLDIETIKWLEDYLKSYKSAMIIVSHDRMFIDNICNIIYEIDYGRTIRYVGNYEFYEKTKKMNYEKMLSDYEYQQKEIKRLQAIYERFRFKPSKASMALSKLRQIEKMDLIEKPNKIDMRVFKTNLSEIEQSVKKVLIAEDLEIGYTVPLAKINLEVLRGKKIGIIGKNGIGKSTLLKTLNGSIEPLSGNVSYGLKVKAGYFDQTLAMIDKNQTVLNEFREALPELTEEVCRSALGSFLFKGDDVYKNINVLSGGEKVRLQLCKIFYNKPNFLLLDEPTNHMDIVGKEHLEDILSQYEGTIIFVSHDRYFVRKIATDLLVFDDDGVNYYPFGYDEYLRTVENSKKDIIIEEKKPKKVVEKKSEEKVNVYNVRKELNKVEQDIIKLETKITELNNELFNMEDYTDFSKQASINKRIEELKKDLAEKNTIWEKLTDQLI